jgi:hypothetical protein
MVGLITKGIIAWMLLVSSVVCIMLDSAPDSLLTFYRLGPQKDLVVIGIVINNNTRYAIVALFCITNSLIRSVESDIVHSWIINNVQDKSVHKTDEIRHLAYQVSIVHSIYQWWDWFIDMNILLAQIDLFLMEMLSSVLTSIITTRMYLTCEPTFVLL